MIVPRTEQTTRSVAAHYDDLDPFYRELWGEHVHHGLWQTGRESPAEATLQLIRVVAGRAEVGAGDTVCDVGCGYGGTARVLAREYGARVTALTVSSAQYAYARGLDPDASNPDYLLRAWEENGLPSDAFDAVLCIECSEHLADKPAFFAEARRVLRPGGRLVVCAWLSRPAPRPWEVRHLLEPICREGRLAGLGSADEYRQLARAAGLDPVGFEDLSQRVRRTWSICARCVVAALVRKPEYRRFVLRSQCPDRVFALTLFRIWIAYAVGSLRYGVLTARKPDTVRFG